jgi:hypothetical protein
MKNNKRIIIVLLLLITYWQAFSQSELFEQFTEKDGLASNKVFDVIQSTDGSVWFATSKGVSRFNGLSFQTHNGNNGLPEQEITGFVADRQNRIWCYSLSGKLYYFEDNSFHTLPVNQQLADIVSNRIINSIYFDRSSTAWIGLVISGIVIKISADMQIEQININPSSASFFVWELESQKHIFGSIKNTAVNNRLLYKTPEKSVEITLSENSSYSKSKFTTLKSNQYLYSKGHELILLHGHKVIARLFMEKTIENILYDSYGKIWVALNGGGVLCYPEGNITQAGSVNYLGGKTITSVYEDRSGNLYFTSAEDGFFIMSQTFHNYSPPGVFSKQNDINKTTTELSSAENNLAEKNDRVFFIADNNPYDSIPPAVYITGIKINNADTVIDAEYKLPYYMNSIKINYAGFAPNNSQALQYKYRMYGIDEEWVYTGNTQAQYTSIPAGAYQFKVAAMNKNGFWSESVASVVFKINPPFWQETWFFSATVFSSVLAVSLLFLYRIKTVKRKEREKAEFVKQLADMELQALRAQMNPHFIFNTLSSIQHFISSENTDEALRYLSKFAKLMRAIMDNSKRPLIPVKEEIETIRLYLDLEALRFKNKFTFSIIHDENIDIAAEEIPSMLIQPYVENAIIHGLMHKAGMGEIIIKFEKIQNGIKCIIEDNGIGRKKSNEINKERNKSHRSSAMMITEDRLKIINSRHNSNLNVIVTDLEDINNMPAGTRIEIFIPV